MAFLSNRCLICVQSTVSGTSRLPAGSSSTGATLLQQRDLVTGQDAEPRPVGRLCPHTGNFIRNLTVTWMALEGSTSNSFTCENVLQRFSVFATAVTVFPVLLPARPLVFTPLYPLVAPAPPSVSRLPPGLSLSPTRSSSSSNLTRSLAPVPQLYSAARNLDICYFLGSDIFTSHVPCNPNWGDGTNEVTAGN